MAQEPSNALRYRQLLEKVAEGVCLWYPSETAAIGSVGYLRDGYFVTLFNAFNPPDGLPGLPEATGPPDLDTSTPPNTQLAWMSLAQSGCSLRAGVPVDTTLVNIGFTVHSQTADAAFLVPGGKNRRVKTLFNDRQLKRYIAFNYNAIAQRYKNHQLRTLMILRGTTHTNGYCRGLLHQSHQAAAGTLTLNPLGVEMFSLEMGGNRSVIDQWLIQAVPANAQNESNPIYTHCIIVKPIVFRKRDRLLQRMTSPFSILTQDPIDLRATPGPISNALTQQVITGTFMNTPPASSALVPAASDALDDGYHDEDYIDCDNADEQSLSDGADPPDDFEALLDAVLAVYADEDAIIVDWDVLHTFWQRHTVDPKDGYSRLDFHLEALGDTADGSIAQLHRVSLLRDAQPVVRETALPKLTALPKHIAWDPDSKSIPRQQKSMPAIEISQNRETQLRERGKVRGQPKAVATPSWHSQSYTPLQPQFNGDISSAACESSMPLEKAPRISPAISTTPSFGQAREHHIMYYFRHVCRFQYNFARPKDITSALYDLISEQPHGAVTSALCCLAATYDSRTRQAQGLPNPYSTEAINHTRFYQDVLWQVYQSKQVTGQYATHDAVAAIHGVFFWLFHGGSGEWGITLGIAREWLGQTPMTTHDNPIVALIEQDDKSQFASRATMWMDIFGSISELRTPRFLGMYKRLFKGYEGYWTSAIGVKHSKLRMDDLMGCPDEVMLCIAETADLASWANEQRKVGKFSVREMLSRASAIERELCTQEAVRELSRSSSRMDFGSVDRLLIQPGVTQELVNDSTSSSSVASTHSSPTISLSTVPDFTQSLLSHFSPLEPNRTTYTVDSDEEMRKQVARVFRSAAIVYLYTTMYGPYPTVPEVVDAVSKTVEALKMLPPSQYDRSLVFPISLAGIMTNDPNSREFLRNRLAIHDTTVGNVGEARMLMEAVWERRDKFGDPAPDWIQVMREMNLNLLLV